MSDKLLKISDELALPLDGVTQRYAFLGNIGSGKSYGAGKLAEEMLTVGAQVVVLDPVGVWYGLRILPSGKPSKFDVPIFGGLHADVPLEPTAGAMLADLIVDRRLSAVIDVSQFPTDKQVQKFARDFGERFFFRKKQKRSAVNIILEECQEFVPQNPMAEEIDTLHQWQRILKLGRNFGIGATLISQRPQEVHKKVLNLTECIFAFQMNGPHERKAMDEWVKDKNLDRSLVDELPTIEVGHPYAWSPRWLKVCRRVKIARKQTADVSATPSFEESKHIEPQKLSDAELKKLGSEIQATLERAKQNDPGELRRRIIALERELAQQPQAPAAPSETIEVPVLAKGDLEEFKLVAGGLQAALDNVSRSLKDCLDSFLRKISLFPHSAADPRRVAKLPILPARLLERPKVLAHGQAAAPAKNTTPKAVVPEGEFAPSKPQREIMAILATYGSCSKRRLAIRAIYSIGGGGFNNAIYGLRSRGLIQGDDPFELTPEGARLVKSMALSYAPPAPDQLLARWVQEKLGKAEAEVLQVLFGHGPDGLSVEEIAGLTPSQYAPTGGGFMNAVYHLRSSGLIEGEKNALKIVEDFFS